MSMIEMLTYLVEYPRGQGIHKVCPASGWAVPGKHPVQNSTIRQMPSDPSQQPQSLSPAQVEL